MPLSSIGGDRQGKKSLTAVSFAQAVVLGLVLASAAPVAQSWSKEGHMLTCQIAQDLLEPAAAHAVKNLLPEDVDGDLSALCVWPDQVRHWYKYRWTSPLHFIDTPDKACSFVYSRDCHGPDGAKDMCVAGAIANFTSQLMHYKHGSADRRYNLTEALLFLSHFMGDVHQPMHVGFTSDQGGNSIDLRWFSHKSNLHHVWDREIILTAIDKLYGKDIDKLLIFRECVFTRMCWLQTLSKLQATHLYNSILSNSITEWYMNVGKGYQRKQQQHLHGLITYFCWEIWKERNARTFQRSSADHIAVAQKICDAFRLFLSSKTGVTSGLEQ